MIASPGTNRGGSAGFRRPRLRGLAVGAALAAASGMFVVLSPPAGALGVGDEAALRAAFADPNQTAISISSDISLTCAGGNRLSRTSANALTVTGNGHTIAQTCPSVDLAYQNGPGALTLEGLTLIGAPDGGGEAGNGVTSEVGSLTVTHVTITGAPRGNGFAAFGGDLSLTDVTVDGFDAGVHGHGSISLLRTTVRGAAESGVESDATTGLLDVRDSTVVNDYRGIFSDAVPLHVTNSTVSGNSRDGVLSDGGPIDLVHATLFGNGQGSGSSNVGSFGGPVTTTASVIAGAAALNPSCRAGITVISHGFNFSDDLSCQLTDPTDHGGAGSPLLGALVDNGGPTPTHLPLSASPLLDAIPLASCPVAGITTDQRGLARPSGTGCDIGAVEVQVGTPAPTSTTTSTSTSTSTTTSTVRPAPTTTTLAPTVAAATATPVPASPAFAG